MNIHRETDRARNGLRQAGEGKGERIFRASPLPQGKAGLCKVISGNASASAVPQKTHVSCSTERHASSASTGVEAQLHTRTLSWLQSR
jgi:hypothetical protein